MMMVCNDDDAAADDDDDDDDDDNDTIVDDKNYEDTRISCGRIIIAAPSHSLVQAVWLQCRYL